MIVACNEPDQDRHFCPQMAGAPVTDADFITTREPVSSAPQWELAIGVDDLEGVAACVRSQGGDVLTPADQNDGRSLRLNSTQGLTFQVRSLGP
ncbi:VOC family protein [Streptomyces sp. NPDC093250]|uniref:VOC family protein n=1 Tax=unclassified Streptomyces TaxID=2593676 RepID=UPI00341F65A0